MKNIEELDKNLAVEASIEKDGICFFDVEAAPFQVYGIFKANGLFRVIPEEVAKSVSKGVYDLHTRTAGGRVRFITDSPYVAIKTEYTPAKLSLMALTGSAGFDMYAECAGENKYKGVFVPPFDVKDGYESVKELNDCQERVITINFPLYSSVSKLYIGLKAGSVLKAAPEYKIEKPVVFYGSSITQGGCASRPGSSYQSILSRRFNCNYINLGFAGNAKGEAEMADYIKELDMSIFVMDYDFNAPSIEHLLATHIKMFDAVRAAQPDLPIVILPRPKFYLSDGEEKRLEVIYNTYQTAKEYGDKNVYFISGKKLMEVAKDNGTVDSCHPTDLGFFSMACAIGEVFEKIWKA